MMMPWRLRSMRWCGHCRDDRRADRLIALTGLDPADLKARADEPAVLAAVINFLQSHQPDLLACAEAIGATPDHLIAAAERLTA
jgi:hypothetical protein